MSILDNAGHDLAQQPLDPRPKEYRHVKTSGRYVVLDPAAKVQTSRPLSDYDRVVVYRNLDTQELWVRPADEFFDGRFELLR